VHVQGEGRDEDAGEGQNDDQETHDPLGYSVQGAGVRSNCTVLGVAGSRLAGASDRDVPHRLGFFRRLTPKVSK
jgi:hypothetical protein